MGFGGRQASQRPLALEFETGREWRASNLLSNSLSLSSEETIRADVMSPDGAMVNSSTDLALQRRAVAQGAPPYMASIAPLFLVNTRAISVRACGDALPLPPARVAWPDAPKFRGP